MVRALLGLILEVVDERADFIDDLKSVVSELDCVTTVYTVHG